MLKIINQVLLLINYLLIFNALWTVEISTNAIIQHHSLNLYVKDNWKSSLYIILLLSLLSLAGICSGSLGKNAYLVSLILLVFQSLISLDYHRMLKKYITDSWYVVSFNIQIVLSSIGALLIAFVIVASLVQIEF